MIARYPDRAGGSAACLFHVSGDGRLGHGRLGRKVFGTDARIRDSSKALAANQGLYNGFLAAGLVWGIYGSAKPVLQ